MSKVTIIHADVLAGLAQMPSDSVHCIVTSPPYYGLRSYGIPPSVWGGDPHCVHAWDEERIVTELGRGNWAQAVNGRGEVQGDIAEFRKPLSAEVTRAFCSKCHAWRGHFGLEPTYVLYVKHMVLIMREARRVLRHDGVMWLNLGDTYYTGAGSNRLADVERERDERRRSRALRDGSHAGKNTAAAALGPMCQPNRMPQPGLKPKDLMLVPERVVQALQEPFYTGRIEREMDRAWLAALVDGEGSIGIRRHARPRDIERGWNETYIPYLTIKMADRAPLDKAVQITGCGSVREDQWTGADGRTVRTNRPMFLWRLDGNQAVQVAREVYPHLLIKQPQAACVHTLDVSKKNGRPTRTVPLPAAVIEQRRELYRGIKALNQRQTMEAPDFVEPPPSMYEPGWWVRARCPWIKRNAMPESATDRPANATEYVFLLSKSESYFYDRYAVQVPSSDNTHARMARAHSGYQAPGQPPQGGAAVGPRPNKKKPVAGWAHGAGDHCVLEHNREPKASGHKLLLTRSPGVHPKAAPRDTGVRANESFHATTPEVPAARNRRNTDWFFESWQGMLQDDEGLPLAFVVNPAGFKEAHFATFPPKFVEPMILAGTSEKGCCARCGAPWVRIVDKGAELEEWKRACGADASGRYNGEAIKDYSGTGAQDPSEVKARILAGMRERVTVGWEPTCACEQGEPVPCTAADIFGGSATLGLVAQQLQRDAVLIEIGEQYVEMGVKRLKDESPLLADVRVQGGPHA